MANDYQLRESILRQEYNQADSICISYPKCGRTWIRHVLGHYMHLQYGVENTHRLNSLKENIKARQEAQCPLVSFTHDNHSFASEISHKEFDKLQIKKFIFEDIYKSKKLIFLMRDPIDASVSYYKMCKNMTNVFEGSFEDWLSHPIFGLDALAQWYQIAYSIWQEHQNSCVLHYENLKQERYEWRDLIRFVTDENVNNDWLDESLQARDFASLKQKEMKAKNITDPDSDKLFVRQGGRDYQFELPEHIQKIIRDHKQLDKARQCVESMV